MKLKTSKVFTKYLVEKLNLKNITIRQEKIGYREYHLNTPICTDDEYDYNPNTDTYNIIKVIYPYEYYAMPLYITTEMLHKWYKQSNGNIDDFIDIIKNEIEI